MPFSNGYISVANTFDDWRVRTNELIDYFNTSVLRLNETVSGNVTLTGTAAFGSLVANTFIVKGTPWIDITAYGAVGDGTTNNDVAIAAAVAALPAGGGVLYVPHGNFLVSPGVLNFNNKTNVRLFGETKTQAAVVNNTSRLYTNATTNASFLTADTIKGFELDHIWIYYTSASYTGHLVDLRSTNLTQITDSVYIHDSRFTKSGAGQSANSLIFMDLGADITIERNLFSGANSHIRGTSNVYINLNRVAIAENYFNGAVGVPLMLGGTAITVRENVFEANTEGSPTVMVITTANVNALVFQGNWVGDGTNVGTVLDFTGGTVEGAVIQGNIIDTGSNASAIGIKLGAASGVTITGNEFYGHALPIDFGTANNVYAEGNQLGPAYSALTGFPTSNYPEMRLGNHFFGNAFTFHANTIFKIVANNNATNGNPAVWVDVTPNYASLSPGLATFTAFGSTYEAGFTGFGNTVAGLFRNLSANGLAIGVVGQASASANLNIGVYGFGGFAAGAYYFGGYLSSALADPATINTASLSDGVKGSSLVLHNATNVDDLITGFDGSDDGRWVFRVKNQGATNWQSPQTVNSIALTIVASNGGTSGIIQSKGTGDFAFVLGSTNDANTRIIANSVTRMEFLNGGGTTLTSNLTIASGNLVLANVSVFGNGSIVSTSNVGFYGNGISLIAGTMGGPLTGNAALSISGTFVADPGAVQIGSYFAFTGAGANTQTQTGHRVDIAAGFTGTGVAIGIQALVSAAPLNQSIAGNFVQAGAANVAIGAVAAVSATGNNRIAFVATLGTSTSGPNAPWGTVANSVALWLDNGSASAARGNGDLIQAWHGSGNNMLFRLAVNTANQGADLYEFGLWTTNAVFEGLRTNYDTNLTGYHSILTVKGSGGGTIRPMGVGTSGSANLALVTNAIARWIVDPTAGNFIPTSNLTQNIGSPTARVLAIYANTVQDRSEGNVLAYGAVGDGVTDDTQAFYDAMANTGTAYIPASLTKKYAVNLVLTVNNRSIIGARSMHFSSANASALVPFNPANPVVQIGDDTKHTMGIVLDKINIMGDGGPSGVGNTGLYVAAGGYRCWFNTISVWNCLRDNIKIGDTNQNWPIAYIYFNGLTVQGHSSSLANGRSLHVSGSAVNATSYTSVVHISNYTFSSAGLGSACEINGVTVDFSQGWMEVGNNTGLILDTTLTGAQATPLAQFSGTSIDTGDSNDNIVLINHLAVPGPVGNYLVGAPFGCDGRLLGNNGTSNTQFSGSAALYNQSSMVYPLIFGSANFIAGANTNFSQYHQIYGAANLVLNTNTTITLIGNAAGPSVLDVRGVSDLRGNVFVNSGSLFVNTASDLMVGTLFKVGNTADSLIQANGTAFTLNVTLLAISSNAAGQAVNMNFYKNNFVDRVMSLSSSTSSNQCFITTHLGNMILSSAGVFSMNAALTGRTLLAVNNEAVALTANVFKLANTGSVIFAINDSTIFANTTQLAMSSPTAADATIIKLFKANFVDYVSIFQTAPSSNDTWINANLGNLVFQVAAVGKLVIDPGGNTTMNGVALFLQNVGAASMSANVHKISNTSSVLYAINSSAMFANCDRILCSSPLDTLVRFSMFKGNFSDQVFDIQSGVTDNAITISALANVNFGVPTYSTILRLDHVTAGGAVRVNTTIIANGALVVNVAGSSLATNSISVGNSSMLLYTLNSAAIFTRANAFLMSAVTAQTAVRFSMFKDDFSFIAFDIASAATTNAVTMSASTGNLTISVNGTTMTTWTSNSTARAINFSTNTEFLGSFTIVDNTLLVQGASTLNSTASVNGTLLVQGALTQNASATVNGTLVVQGALTQNAAATVNSTLLVQGATTLNSTAVVNGTLLIQGVQTQNAAMTVNAALTINGATSNLVVNGGYITANAGGGTLLFHPGGAIAFNGTTVNTGPSTDFVFQNVATIAANTLRNTGDRLVITWMLRLGTNADSKVYQTALGHTAQGAGGFTGGTLIQSAATASVSDDILITLYVTRIGSNSISYYGVNKFVSGSSTQGTVYATAAPDLTAALNLAIGIQSPNSAPTLRISDSHVQFIPINA